MKNLGEKEAWAYPGTASFFEYSYYKEMGKATNFKFCVHIHRIDGNKSAAFLFLKANDKNSLFKI